MGLGIVSVGLAFAQVGCEKRAQPVSVPKSSSSMNSISSANSISKATNLIFRHDGTGQVVVWNSFEDDGSNLDFDVGGRVAPDFTIQGAGDFDGDGSDDLVWRSAGGQVVIWTGLVAGGPRADFDLHPVIASSWKIQAIADFDGDQKADLLWKNDNGAMVLWNNIQSNGGHGDLDFGQAPSSDSRILGAGDFDGNGCADILWQNPSGRISIWSRIDDRCSIEKNFDVAIINPAEWHFQGVGDFDGDGMSDVLWRHNTGQMVAWLGLRTNGMLGDRNVGQPVAPEWMVQRIGDFVGDGKDDVLWRHVEGNLRIWKDIVSPDGPHEVFPPNSNVSNQFSVQGKPSTLFSSLPNGEQALSSQQCRSGHSASGPGGWQMCLAEASDCAKPGSDGVRFGEAYVMGNSFVCERRVGLMLRERFAYENETAVSPLTTAEDIQKVFSNTGTKRITFLKGTYEFSEPLVLSSDTHIVTPEGPVILRTKNRFRPVFVSTKARYVDQPFKPLSRCHDLEVSKREDCLRNDENLLREGMWKPIVNDPDGIKNVHIEGRGNLHLIGGGTLPSDYFLSSAMGNCNPDSETPGGNNNESLNATGLRDEGTALVVLLNSKFILIEGTEFSNQDSLLWLESSEDIFLRDNRLHHFFYKGVTFGRSVNFLAKNNLVSDSVAQCTNSYGFTAEFEPGKQARATIQGNQIRNIQSWDAIESHMVDDIEIIDNTMIEVRNGIDLSAWPKGNSLANVTIRGNSVSGTTFDNWYGKVSVYENIGIQVVANVENPVINGVRLESNRVSGAGSGYMGQGIKVGNIENAEVLDNSVSRIGNPNGNSETVEYIGIHLMGPTRNLTVSRNTIQEVSGFSMVLRGIGLQDPSNSLIVIGNVFIKGSGPAAAAFSPDSNANERDLISDNTFVGY